MFNHLRTMLCLVARTIVSSDSAAIKESTSTLEGLQTVFKGESNANALYLAFAKKADEEGFGEVASLFRAAAKAEEIHARNHRDVIRRMGATPTLNLEPIRRGGHPRKGYRCDSDIYVRTGGRSSHALLYQDALDNLQKRTGKNHTYYVCPDCGNTLEELNIVK